MSLFTNTGVGEEEQSAGKRGNGANICAIPAGGHS